VLGLRRRRRANTTCEFSHAIPLLTGFLEKVLALGLLESDDSARVYSACLSHVITLEAGFSSNVLAIGLLESDGAGRKAGECSRYDVRRILTPQLLRVTGFLENVLAIRVGTTAFWDVQLQYVYMHLATPHCNRVAGFLKSVLAIRRWNTAWRRSFRNTHFNRVAGFLKNVLAIRRKYILLLGHSARRIKNLNSLDLAYDGTSITQRVTLLAA